MKKTDWFGILFLVLFALLVAFFPFNFGFSKEHLLKEGFTTFHWTGFVWNKLENFGNVTAEFPYLMGFFKFALLATFGEMLKHRVKTGNWSVNRLPVRALVWGLYGMLMTAAFALFAQGITNMMGTNLWAGESPVINKSFCNTFIFAFSTSLMMNAIFAYPMMLSHEWFSQVIEKGKFIGGTDFFENLPSQVWGSFIPKTILYFWIPAHTVTFLLPPEFRVLAGAFLSMALGFILTIKAVKKA